MGTYTPGVHCTTVVVQKFKKFVFFFIIFIKPTLNLTISMLHFVLFHNIACYTNSLITMHPC